MLYKLTWQTKVFDDWGDPQFVIGDIGPIHRCYNALIVTHYQEFEGKGASDTLRAVVTAIQPDTTDDRGNVVYEWNWHGSTPEEEEVAK